MPDPPSGQCVLDAIQKRVRDAISELRVSLGTSEWKKIRSVVSRTLTDGIPAMAGLVAGDSQTSRSRYVNWLYSHTMDVLATLNRTPSCWREFGGPLRGQVALTERVALSLSLAFEEIAAKATNLKNYRTSTEVQSKVIPTHLAQLLRDRNLDIDEKWSKRFANVLQSYSDACVYLVLIDIISHFRQWLVVMKATEEDEGQAGTTDAVGTNEENISGDGAYDAMGVHFTFAATPEHLLDEIHATGCELDVSQTEATEQLAELFEGTFCSPEQFCFLKIEAHPDVLDGAVNEYVHRFSGLLLLHAIPEQASTCQVSCSEKGKYSIEYSAGRPTPISLQGLAIPVSPPEKRGDRFVKFSNVSEFCKFPRVHCQSAMVGHAVRLEASPNLREFLDSKQSASLFVKMLLNARYTAASHERLRKALRFWASAELRTERGEQLGSSPWGLADRFLGYCTVLEVLLGAKDSVGDTISARAASILAKSASDRYEEFRNLKKLYDKRSRYVHEGSVLVDWHDVQAIREITRRCLLYAMQWLSLQAEEALDQHGDEILALISEHSERKAKGDSSQTEQTLLEVIRRLFATDDFPRHCDLLRFGGQRV